MSAHRLADVDEFVTVTRLTNGVMIQGLQQGVGCVITLKSDMTVSVRRIVPKIPGDLLTITEAADRLRVSPKRVRQLIAAGRLLDCEDDAGHRTIHVDEVARFAAIPRVSGRPAR